MKARALVTGAGARLGRAMALDLGRRGFDVVVHCNASREPAEEVAAEIRAMGRAAHVLVADLLDEAATQALVPRAVEALGGPLTCLVNSASIFEWDSVETGTRESWDRAMESNLRAPVVLTQRMAEGIEAPATDSRGEPLAQGLVVNIVDQRVRKLTPDFMSYTIAKMGLWAFTRTAAQALAPRIRVNAIGPGPTLQGANQSDAHYAAQRANTVLQRGSNPEDICAALGYFIDAPGVTGQLLCVDGGQHLGWQTPDIQGRN
jgi:NAD(P)-dependent dehydrogenase (short-subunit alcohol dehydrogenase family)